MMVRPPSRQSKASSRLLQELRATLLGVIRLAILGFWHVHAADYAAEAGAHPETEIVAAWDDDAARGEARARELGARFHGDLPELLARSDVDGVIVTTRTSAHREVITAAADAGKHVFTEKVLALTPPDAQRIVNAVERNRVKLTVSLPRLSHGYTIAIRKVLASGRLGEVSQVRCRLAHDGALGQPWLPGHFFDPVEAGGGALVDLGCHPLYLTRLFLGGMPESVSAEYGRVTGHAVDDNAAAILRHRTGALGIAETGFVTPHSPFTIEVHGTKGSLMYGTPEPDLFVRTAPRGSDATWTQLPIPQSGPSPFEQWLGHIAHDTNATENIALALDLTTLVDAANRSALTGTAIRI
jgi:1,5-anhydro-D-fructose reductase (1,5-anhydro-D-mannitol-forming)